MSSASELATPSSDKDHFLFDISLQKKGTKRIRSASLKRFHSSTKSQSAKKYHLLPLLSTEIQNSCAVYSVALMHQKRRFSTQKIKHFHYTSKRQYFSISTSLLYFKNSSFAFLRQFCNRK